MSSTVTIACSRCRSEIEGMRDKFFTGGFYDVREGSAWSRFANVGETELCDACMFADPRYREIYGVNQ